jgi:hypothetical protein
MVSAQESPRDRKPARFSAIAIQKIARRPRQSIEPCYQEHVTRPELRDNAAELDAIALRSTGRLTPDLFGACHTQPLHLSVKTLRSVDTRA